MADPIRVNGNQYSWGSIILKIGGERLRGFTEITFSDKRERVKAYGSARHHAPMGRSAGKYTVEPVKIVGWKGAIQTARAAFASQAEDGVSYGNVEAEIVVQYVETGEEPITVEIERAVWMSNNTSDTESADPLKEEIEFDVMLIRRNNLVLFDASEDQP